MKGFITRLHVLLLCLFGMTVNALAQPVYTGNTFDKVQTVSEDATLFFGVVVVLAVLVTGFFLGRKWLRRVG